MFAGPGAGQDFHLQGQPLVSLCSLLQVLVGELGHDESIR